MADSGEILRNIGEFGLLPAAQSDYTFLAKSIFVFYVCQCIFNTDWILRADPNLTTDEQLNLTLPREEDGTFSRCRMFVPVDWDIGSIREYGLNETTGCQSGWVYYNTLYEATIVTDLLSGLGCPKNHGENVGLSCVVHLGSAYWPAWYTLSETGSAGHKISLPQISVKDTVNKGGIKIIFRSSVLTRYFFIVAMTWFSLNLALYCLYFNMQNFGLSIFVTQLLFGAIEIPANIFFIWLLEVFGRRGLFITTATALGAISGRTGGLLAPLLNILATYHWAIPTAVFSSFTLVSGALGFLLPETRRKEPPETADEAETNRNWTSTSAENCPHANTTKL